LASLISGAFFIVVIRFGRVVMVIFYGRHLSVPAHEMQMGVRRMFDSALSFLGGRRASVMGSRVVEANERQELQAPSLTKFVRFDDGGLLVELYEEFHQLRQCMRRGHLSPSK
jgi:hypothetical protein